MCPLCGNCRSGVEFRQIPQALQIEHHEERLGRREGMRRPRTQRSGPACDQVLVARPGKQIAANLLAKDAGQMLGSVASGLVLENLGRHGKLSEVIYQCHAN